MKHLPITIYFTCGSGKWLKWKPLNRAPNKRVQTAY